MVAHPAGTVEDTSLLNEYETRYVRLSMRLGWDIKYGVRVNQIFDSLVWLNKWISSGPRRIRMQPKGGNRLTVGGVDPFVRVLNA